MNSKSQRQQAVTNLKQNLILDAALNVISRDGYQAARLEDIAQEAGFSKASLYHYFPDRESLVLELIIREQLIVINRCQEILSKNLPLSDSLKNMMLLFCEKFRHHAQFANSMGMATPSGLANFAGMVEKHTELFATVQSNKDEVSGLIVQLIQSGIEQGILEIPIDAGAVGVYVMAMVHSIFMEAYQVGIENYNFEKAVEKFFVFLSPWFKGASETSLSGDQHA